MSTLDRSRLNALARQLEMQAAWCERHHSGCDCIRIYRANAARLRAAMEV